MYRICGFGLGTNIEVRPVAEKKFYLRLAVGKMHPLPVFTKKYLWPYGCSDTNFTASVNCTNSNTEILNKIMGIDIIEAQV